ncbi:MAG: acyl-CoA dehydrogenase family protein [Peptoniphilaceae bacterium]|nr:acyl-CoA dehydrogenase family protein [Peptoniphilaceae bacterium]MDY6085294.1 acyl-CoA dehydrogenase family protein [Peptoniphilaceae bacterium]
MAYQLTKEHEALRKIVREFAEKEYKPIAFKNDQEEIFPEEVVMKMGQMGLMGIPFEKEYGGQGLDTTSYAITVEELSRVDGGLGVICSAHTSLGSWPIWAYGTEEQKQKYLVPLAKGEKIGAFGLTEEHAGSDASGTETTAVLEGDHYILNGHKIFITNGCRADTYVIFAVTSPEKGNHGISAFIVEKGWEGFTFPTQYDKLGIRSSITSELSFKNVKVPKENLLGKEGEGFKIAMTTLDGGRIGIASQALGIAQGAYEATVAYARERIQFGAPIAANQGVSFKIADMATRIEASRHLIYNAAELKTNHGKYTKEAAMAKLFASDTAMWVTTEAIQLHGGNGFIKGFDVERAFRDAKITQIYEGTNEVMHVVISGQVIGRMKRKKSAATVAETGKQGAVTGPRKNIMIEGTPEEQVKKLVEALKGDGYAFDTTVDVYAPVDEVERLVSVGQGIGEKENLDVAIELAEAAGAAISSSRPVAETLGYLPIERYVGMSGQKFKGNLYFAMGISGAGQHLRGIKEAATIVAVNTDPDAPIFANADYGIVGDVLEIMPLLTAELEQGQERHPAEAFEKKKRNVPQEPRTKTGIYVCNGCGHEYDPARGDAESGVAPGTPFEQLPDTYLCPKCGDPKSGYIPVE